MGRARRSNVIGAVCFHTSDKCKTIVKTARKCDFLYHRCHWRRRRAALELTEVSPESASGCWWGGALLWCWTLALFSGSPGSALCLSTHTNKNHEITPSCTTCTRKPEQRCRQWWGTPGSNNRADWDVPHLFPKASVAASLCRLNGCPPRPPVDDSDRPTHTWRWPHSGWSPPSQCPGPLSPA